MSALSVDFAFKETYSIEDLLAIMRILRGENGCPWDREQTHQSIRNNFIEETYEAVEAIDNSDPVLLEEELGDVLLQVVYHAEMEREAGRFSFEDVADGICQKLIQRHPHIFGDVVAGTTDEVLDNWDEIKKKTKGQTTYTDTLKSVPKVFPSLMRAAKVQKRAAKSGFAYPDGNWAMEALSSEVEELREALRQNDLSAASEELGDLLLSAANLSRYLDVDAEECLGTSCDKFISRFERLEELAASRKVDMKKASPQEIIALWEEAKRQHKSPNSSI